MVIDDSAQIITNKMVIPAHYVMEIHSPNIALKALPGQFLHIKVTNNTSPLLRRPISIHMRDREKGSISILYRVVGTGTQLLSRYKPGDRINIIGPLGNGFPLAVEFKRIAVVGGGIGTAPLLFLALEAVNSGRDVLYIEGARCKDALLLSEHLENSGCRVMVATDDGSLGYRGFPTELLKSRLERESFDAVYACGPKPMLRGIKKLSLEYRTPAFISLEERMGCGIGACLSCVCKVIVDGGSGAEYRKVCTDGPVFPAEAVMFDE
jgi:dihydroorotate dehydrogenase electron transfer subunit